MVYSLNRLSNKASRRSPPGVAIEDPLRHLVECHDRIEEHLQILERAVRPLRADSEQKRREAREALRKALDFLKAMGALHTKDEEESLFPRLRANLRDDPSGLAELMTLLESQHRDKEAVYEELVAWVSGFPAAPESPTAEQVSRLEGLTAQLTDHYRPHIMIENQRLIPLSGENLTESDREEIRREMLARRAT